MATKKIPTLDDAGKVRDKHLPNRLSVDSRFAEKVAGKSAPLVVALAGDSTGDESAEWFRKMWVTMYSAARPWVTANYRSWNDAAQAYDANVVAQAGVAPISRTITVWDTFTRTAAEAVGTKPERGPAWAGVAGSWSINGTQLSAVAQTVGGISTTDTTRTGGRRTITATIVMDTTTPTKRLEFWMGANSSNRINVQISSASGTNTWEVYKQIAGAGASVVAGTGTILAGGGAAATAQISLTLDGNAVSATVDGNTVTAALSAGDAAALATNNTAYIVAAGAVAGTKINEYRMDIEDVGVVQTLDIYNSSKAGSDLTYQQSRINAMYPVAPDLMFISSSHNYGTMDGPTYVAAVKTFIAAFLAKWPGTPIIVSSQNPETPPVAPATRAAHRARLIELRKQALIEGWPYIGVLEAFEANGSPFLVRGDGVHPTAASTFDGLTDPLNGQFVWATAAYGTVQKLL